MPGAFPDRIIALVPDHAVPDSALFRQTTFDSIPDRSLPSGLDVAAALGHTVAADELRRSERQAKAALQAVERNKHAMRDDGKSVYRGWLGALGKLAAPDPRAPEFMRTSAWSYEKLNTCIAGWSQLRHANILYAAHSYATLGMDDETPRGWVEPYPAFYRALADLADRSARTLASIGGLDRDRRHELARFAAKCREFASIAEAELKGRLTRSQGEVVRNFGAWLTGFPVRSEPTIADTATGMHGEVLHAAAGDMNPIVAIPDRKAGVGYVGWVSSYYEIVRPTTERLTDAQWRSMLEGAYDRPERPGWSAHFIHVDRGPRWQALAPLRDAEALFRSGKADEALAVLNRTIAGDPASETATECRYRIGEHWMSLKRYDDAEREWTACLHMHGGEAWDRAREGLYRLRWERFADKRWRDEMTEGTKRLRELMARLRGQLTTDERAELEREAVALAIARKAWTGLSPAPDMVEPPVPIRDLAAVCRQPAMIEALDWYRLIELGDEMQDRLDTDGREEYVAGSARFVRSAKSPALRASICVRAVMLGYMNDRPVEAARLLAQCVGTDIEADRSEPMMFVRSVLRSRNEAIGPDMHTRDRAREAGENLMTRLWHAGQINESMQVASIAPTYGQEAKRLRAMYDRFDDYGRAPLAMYARAQGTYGDARAPALLAIADKYPKSRLAPLALSLAAEGLRHTPAGRRRAVELRKRIIRDHPDSPAAALARADLALEAGPLDEAERLYKSFATGRARSESDPWQDVRDRFEGNRRYLLDRVRELRAILEPVLRPAGREDLLKVSYLLDQPWSAWDSIAKDAPNLAAEVRLAFARHPNHPYAAESYLIHHPDHPSAGEGWKALAQVYPGADRAKGVRASIGWLVNLVNRTPPYRYRAEAEAALDRALIGYAETQAVANARALTEEWPGTRAAAIASIVEARTLLITERPEAARKALERLCADPSISPDLRERAERLMTCADVTIAAKRVPPWKPLRVYQGAPPDDADHPRGSPDTTQPIDDRDIILRRATAASAHCEFRDWVFLIDEERLLRAYDKGTGARVAIGVLPSGAWTRVEADANGVRVRDYDGRVAEYGLPQANAVR